MARWFELHSPVEGGTQLHIQALQKVAEVKKLNLDKLTKFPKLRKSLKYIIDLYFEISDSGEVNLQNIYYWQKLKNINLNDFELSAILKIQSCKNINGKN